MVRLSANSIRVVEGGGPTETDDAGIGDTAPSGDVQQREHVGAWLREARESTGRDLRDVAAHLRIRYPYLQAIEEGRFDELPGRAYAVGFIRSYSDHLGLDSDAMVERFKADVDVRTAEQNLKFPTPAPEGRFPGTSILLVSALLAAALIGGWYYYQSRNTLELVRVPAPPAQTETKTDVPADAVATVPRTDPVSEPKPAVTVVERKAPENAPSSLSSNPLSEARAAVKKAVKPVSAPAMKATESQQAAVGTATVADETKPGSAPSAGEPERTAMTDTASRAAKPATGVTAQPSDAATPTARPAAPEPETPRRSEPAAPQTNVAALPAVPVSASSDDQQGRVYGLSNSDARVILLAKDTSWMQVLDADQNEVFTKVLAAGERYHVPNRDGLVMRVGNPSALIVSIDGAAGFPLSDNDQPISGVMLDPARLRDGTAVR